MKLEYSIVILAISIAFSGVWIGNSLKEEKPERTDLSGVLSLSDAADYLEVSEESIKKIIIKEEVMLKENNSFQGMRLPYMKINNEYIFSKVSLDQWLLESMANNREFSENWNE